MLAKLTVKTLDAYNRLARDDEGAAMVEYGVLVALIAAVCVGIITTLGTQVSTAFNTVSAAL